MSQANNSSDVLESLRASLHGIMNNLRSEVLGAAVLVHAAANGTTTHASPTIQDIIESLREPCMWSFKNATNCTEGESSAPFVAANMLEHIVEGKVNGRDLKATFPPGHGDEALEGSEKLLRALNLYDAAVAPGDPQENLSKALKAQIKANAAELPDKLNEMLQRLVAKRDAQQKTLDDKPGQAAVGQGDASVFKHGPIELAIACARFTQAAGIDAHEMSMEDRGQLMKGVDAILGTAPSTADDNEPTEAERNLLALNQRIPLVKLIVALAARQGGKLKLGRSEVEDVAEDIGVAIGMDSTSITLIAGDIADRSHDDLISELRSM